MELPLHCKTPLTTSGIYFLPAGNGKLKLGCNSHSFLIKAVLEAPREQQQKKKIGGGGALKESIERVEKQRAKEGGRRRRGEEEEEDEMEMGMVDGDAESTWEHRVWVATGNAAIVGIMIKAIQAYNGSNLESLGVLASALGGYIFADFATGLYHWAIDNYGNATTPIFGTQIDSFQGHHKRPWVISTGQFANNLHRQARPATFILAPFLLLPSHPFFHTFLAIFAACVVYSQQFHSWVHAKKKHVPPFVLTLQNLGLLLPRKMHGTHHRPPYNINYCIVSGLCNPLLDHFHFFATLEKIIFITCHVKPRSWAETSIDWLQIGSYFADGTEMDDISTP